jgi:hypothetical protein
MQFFKSHSRGWFPGTAARQESALWEDDSTKQILKRRRFHKNGRFSGAL